MQLCLIIIFRVEKLMFEYRYDIQKITTISIYCNLSMF